MAASTSAAASSSDRRLSDQAGANGPGGVAPEAKRLPAGSRNVADVVVDLPGVGDIRFYSKNQVFVASCRRPEHQNFFSDTGSVLTCSRKRTVRAAPKLAKDVRKRSGQGRPLGHLMRWLECGCEPRSSRSMCCVPDVLIEMNERQHGQGLLCYRGLRLCLQKNDLGWSGNPTTNPETFEYFSDCEGISVQSTRLDSALHSTLLHCLHCQHYLQDCSFCFSDMCQ